MDFTDRIEKTRVDENVDFDKLTLEVWTNDSIQPKDAVSLIVSGYLSVLSTVFDDEEFNLFYPKMKTELALLLEEITNEVEKKSELDAFFDRYTNFKCYKKILFGEKI